MSLALESLSRVRLLGGDLDLLTPSNLLAFVAECIEDGRKAIIANHNAHSLALIRRDPEMDAFYRMADLVEIDSMPLIAWGRAMGAPLGRRHRCTYLGWRAQFWSAAQENGWRVYYLGGGPHVAEKAAERIRQAWPGVEIAVHHGFFEKSASSAANEEVVRAIRNFAPDILFVGLGMPLQEKWIAANHHRFDYGVLIPVGAAFDYEAGAQVTPPRWIGRLGLEWLFRFATQPRRLFARYFIEPWALIGPALDDVNSNFRIGERVANLRVSTWSPRLIGIRPRRASLAGITSLSQATRR